jgi:ribosome biogenesis GTPase A
MGDCSIKDLKDKVLASYFTALLMGSGLALGKPYSARVICVGLDNSGKSTIINHLKPPSV